MKHILSYYINETSNHMTVKDYLKTMGFSSQNLIFLKQSPNALLVNETAVHINHLLQLGDILNVTILEETPSKHIVPVPLSLDIVYEDEDLIVINKAAGMPIHPSQSHYDHSLANGLAWYYQKQNLPFVFRCINRLDKDTSGLTLIAKHMVSAGILGRDVASKQHFTREYLAIVRGSLAPTSGTISAPISRKPGSIMERQVDFAQGETAITNYHLVEEKNGHSLVSLTLETGRTHQIRVHMKYLGYPLIGDYLYNPDTELIHRQALHSHKLSFLHPITKQYMEFVATLPQDMRNVLT